MPAPAQLTNLDEESRQRFFIAYHSCHQGVSGRRMPSRTKRLSG
jgi:hypothetical protein